jgi:hypothetical protein
MATATADKPTAARSLTPELPPGPDWSLAKTTWRWWNRPLPMLEYCRARYGDMFTIRLPYEGRWVFVSDPEAIKQVFTGDPNLLHAGAANIVLLPVLGDRSVLLLDEPRASKKWRIGKASEKLRTPLGSSSSGMKTPDRKYSGSTVALVTAGAASSVGITAASAKPRQEKENAPTASVTSSAGSVLVGIVTP